MFASLREAGLFSEGDPPPSINRGLPESPCSDEPGMLVSPQQPIDEPQQQLTQPNTTTTDTQHSTPSDRDENMTEQATTRTHGFEHHSLKTIGPQTQPQPTAPKPSRQQLSPEAWATMTRRDRKLWLAAHKPKP